MLQNNGGDTLKISGNGNFTFATPVLGGNPFNVTVSTQPTNPSQTCTVAHGSGTVSGEDITNVAVTCTTNSYTVGGTVSGLAGSGLVLADNGTNDTPVAKNGPFTFTTALASGSAYSVTVATQPTNPAQTCVLSNGSGTVATANVTSIRVFCPQAVGQFAYVVTTGTSGPGTLGSIAVYTINPTSGALTLISGSAVPAGPTAQALQLVPHTSFAWSLNPAAEYTPGFQFSDIYDYSVNPSTGLLTAVAGSPFTALNGTTSTPACGANGQTGLGATSNITFYPSGTFGYVTNGVNPNQVPAQANSQIWQFTVDPSTGAPSLVPGSGLATVCSQEPQSVTVDPSGQFAYTSAQAVDPFPDGATYAFTINSQTGTLTPVAGSPYSVAGAGSVVIDPAGRFAYVLSNEIYAFAINASSGALTPIAGSPFAIAASTMVIDPNGQFAYITNTAGVYAYSIGLTGSLTAISASPVAALSHPTSFTIDPSGQFAYAVAYIGTSGVDFGVYAFTINPTTGALVPVAGSPFAPSSPPGYTAAITVTN
jgi:6-phosphogluconolactonase (cycloisomerase 2 family)